jgi:hypothetical protein
VEVVIDQQGVPSSVKSATSLPDNVVQALAKWRFRPGRRKGAPVGYRVGILVPTHRKIGEMVGRMSRSWNFSREVNDTFAGAKDLDRSTAAHLDEDLTRSPSNRTARLTLPAYSRTASDLDALQIRLRQLLWFAPNQPKHEVLAGPFATEAGRGQRRPGTPAKFSQRHVSSPPTAPPNLGCMHGCGQNR